MRRRVGGKVVRQIPVEKSEVKDSEENDDPTYCEICGSCDREDHMLLCDGCDLGYHMECLDPPLDHVPLDNWYCAECDHNNSNNDLAEEVDFLNYYFFYFFLFISLLCVYSIPNFYFRWTLA